MTTSLGARRMSIRLLLCLIGAAVVSGLLVFTACFMVWYHVGGGAWHGKTHVEAARLISQDTLLLSVVSPGCGGVPHFTVLNETEVEVQVAFRVSHNLLVGGDDCLRPQTLSYPSLNHLESGNSLTCTPGNR